MKKIYLFCILVAGCFSAYTQICQVNSSSSVNNLICGSPVQLNASYSFCWQVEELTSNFNKLEITSTNVIHCIKPYDTYNQYARKEDSSWQISTIGSGNVQLRGIVFPTTDIGYIVGYVYPSICKIFKTMDGGVEWNDISIYAPSMDTVEQITFINENVGFIEGNGYISKTSDGGETWSQPYFIGGYFMSIYFLDVNVGFIGSNDKIYKTLDGGLTWNLISSMNGSVFSLWFIDSLKGFCVGYNIYKKTNDGGLTWSDMTVPAPGTNNHYNEILFLEDDQTGYLISSRSMLKSTDCGLTWNNQCYDSIFIIDDIDFSDSENGCILGWKYNSSYYAVHYIAEYPGTIETDYMWTGPGLQNNTISNPIAYPTSNGSNEYVVNATATFQNTVCSGSDTLEITVQPISTQLQNISAQCEQNVQIIASTNYQGPLENISYHWFPEGGLSDPYILNPIVNVDSNMTYTLNITTLHECVAANMLNVNLIQHQPQQICMVSVNEQNKNEIVWNNHDNADYYKVFKEGSMTNQFNHIGNISADSISHFVDFSSNPATNSNRYKISMIDKCNIETEVSMAHKTMHLIIYEGSENKWFLMWEPYQGFEVESYLIYRGLSETDLELFASVPASVTQYTDIGAPEGVYYQIQVVCPENCNPRMQSNVSRSNLAFDPSLGFPHNELSKFMLYPSPASDFITLKMAGNNSRPFKSVEIYSIYGNLIHNINSLSSNTVNISNLAPGLYMLKVDHGNTAMWRKFVKE